MRTKPTADEHSHLRPSSVSLTLMCLSALWVSAAAAQPEVFYVDAAAKPGSNGSSWFQAFNSLTDALDVAQPQDQVWVAAGVYIPDTPAGRDATFEIPDGVEVYGGFEGDETSVAARPSDPLANPTILAGGRPAVYSIVTVSGAGPSTVLDGVRISSGSADSTTNSIPRRNGGGIFGLNATPTLRNIIIDRCDATQFGGGIYIVNDGTTSFALLDNVIVSTCSARNGGGAYLNANVQIINSRFTDNQAQELGGGLTLAGDYDAVIQDTQIDNNAVTANNGSGGGMHVEKPSGANVVEIDRTVFDQNEANGGGGISMLRNGRVIIRGSRITRNTARGAAGGGGGGIRVSPAPSIGPDVLVENSLIAGNTSEVTGGAMLLNSQLVTLVNTTITGNTSEATTGGIAIGGGSLLVDNSIVWDNTSITTSPTRTTSINPFGTATSQVNRSIVEFWQDGPGPLGGLGTSGNDPMLVDADGTDNAFGTDDDNVRLMPGSPAIDAGNTAAVSALTIFDYYGDPRFRNDTGTTDTGPGGGGGNVVDIGAAEFQGTTPPDTCLPDLNGNGVTDPGDFTAWIAAFNAGDLAADQNGNGTLDPGDFTAWIANYNAGC